MKLFVCVCAAGGAEAQGAVGGAVQDRAGGGGGQGGSSNPGGGAEAGEAEDGQERISGEGKQWKLSYRKLESPDENASFFFFHINVCLKWSPSGSQQTSISLDMSNLQDWTQNRIVISLFFFKCALKTTPIVM